MYTLYGHFCRDAEERIDIVATSQRRTTCIGAQQMCQRRYATCVRKTDQTLRFGFSVDLLRASCNERTCLILPPFLWRRALRRINRVYAIEGGQTLHEQF